MHSGLRWLWVSVVVFFLDVISKYFALHFLTEYEPYPVVPFFNLTLAYNKGAAFSFLNSASGWQTWFFGGLAIVISAGIVIWLKRLSYQQRWLSIALALIIGGALGNLFDRIYYGHVIDFIELYASRYHFPVFNFADSAIFFGAVMLIWDGLTVKRNQS